MNEFGERIEMKSHKVIAIIFSMFLLTSCCRSFGSQLFSYPPGSKPHENNWTYFGVVRQWEPNFKALSQRGKRKIEIIVSDKSDHKVLEDSFQIDSAYIHPEINWTTFEELSINLYEEGNKFASDDYNKQLIKEGPRKLNTLLYSWTGNKFVRKSSEPALRP